MIPLPRPSMPVLIYEEEGALLRRRADLAIPLRVQDTLIRENRRPGIAQPPAVNIVKLPGLLSIFARKNCYF